MRRWVLALSLRRRWFQPRWGNMWWGIRDNPDLMAASGLRIQLPIVMALIQPERNAG